MPTSDIHRHDIPTPPAPQNNRNATPHSGRTRASRPRTSGCRWRITRPPVRRPPIRSVAPSPSNSAARWRGIVLLPTAALTSVGLVAGCDQPAGTPPPAMQQPGVRHAAPVPARTGDAATAALQAVAAYRGMWRAYQAAVAVPEPDPAALSLYTSGPVLSRLTEGVHAAQLKGLKGTGSMGLSPTITSATPAAAPTAVEITDCMDTSRWRLIRTSGEPYTDAPGGRRLIVATAKRAADGWKVDQLTINAVGTC